MILMRAELVFGMLHRMVWLHEFLGVAFKLIVHDELKDMSCGLHRYMN